jgi:hypothetical protein
MMQERPWKIIVSPDHRSVSIEGNSKLIFHLFQIPKSCKRIRRKRLKAKILKAISDYIDEMLKEANTNG